MAGDWIKMRVNLVTHPKVLAIAEALAMDSRYCDWSNLAGFAVSLGGTEAETETERYAALRVTRYVTVCALLRFWGYANEHADGETITSLRLDDIDEVVQVPGFGRALASVGWAAPLDGKRGIVLPQFNKFNDVAKARTSAAERQKRYREKQKGVISDAERDVTRDVTPNVTGDVTSHPREEKRREEKNKEEKSVAARKRALPHDFAISDRVRHWAQQNNHPHLEKHLESFKLKSEAKGYKYTDWDAAFMTAIRENWAQLKPSTDAPVRSTWE